MRAVFVALVTALLLACGTTVPVPTAPTTAKAPDVTTVHVTRECDVTLHADKNFSPEARALFQDAANVWRGPSAGRIAISVTYDVDADSVADLEAHVRAGHSLLLMVSENSELVRRLDEKFGQPVAVTFDAGDGAKHVLLIVERTPRDKVKSYMAHEFGHVCGLPDLPVLDAIMSGMSIPSMPEPETLTAEDVALCRSAHYCD